MVTHTVTMLHAVEKVMIMEAPVCTPMRRADTMMATAATVSTAVTVSLKISMPISR
jgi:hypothetical protein